MSKGLLVVFSAPSGCGKDTVFQRLRQRNSNIVESVSATTRLARNGEIDGETYFFVDEHQFKNMIDNNELLEYAQYNNCYYGTPKFAVENAINNGKICFLIIEVQGAKKIMQKYPQCVTIFLVPPSEEVLKQRLIHRNTDTQEMINNRLQIAKTELTFKDMYKYNVINDDLDKCVDEIEKIIDFELNSLNQNK